MIVILVAVSGVLAIATYILSSMLWQFRLRRRYVLQSANNFDLVIGLLYLNNNWQQSPMLKEIEADDRGTLKYMVAISTATQVDRTVMRRMAFLHGSLVFVSTAIAFSISVYSGALCLVIFALTYLLPIGDAAKASAENFTLEIAALVYHWIENDPDSCYEWAEQTPTIAGLVKAVSLYSDTEYQLPSFSE